jgi:muramoyltetrapeptide carboxypeptidase
MDVKTQATKESVRDVLFGKKYGVTYNSEENTHNRLGTAIGCLVGGNLSLLYSLIGSPSALETKDKILFIEDLDEYLYHVDRMMQNLKRNGLLKDLKGLIVGGMSDMNDNAIPFGKTSKEIVAEAVSIYDFPVCFDFPAGHILDNRALILGREVSLEVSENSVSLRF